MFTVIKNRYLLVFTRFREAEEAGNSSVCLFDIGVLARPSRDHKYLEESFWQMPLFFPEELLCGRIKGTHKCVE